jgi:uncharacterized membrane protein
MFACAKFQSTPIEGIEMLPNPLHPAVVHFPIVLVTLLPIVAVTALILITKGRPVRSLWLVVVLVSGALTVSSWLAVETGEDQEEVVEDVVANRAIHEHEEAAELFLILSTVVLGVLAVGFAKGKTGEIARLVGSAAAIALVAAGLQVGRSGGELVYVHGAGQAYTEGGTQWWDDLGLDDSDDDGDDDQDDAVDSNR